jgi:hypothetical protein
MGWWKSVWIEKSSSWTYVELNSEKNIPSIKRESIRAEQSYLHIFLRSLKIRNTRVGLKRFHGTIHSFISVPYSTGTKASFHVVTTPANLEKIDSAHVDRVVVMDQRLLGPIPWRGGDLELEIGLFSIKEEDLASPFLALLETMSRTAGVSFVSTALPLVAPISQGIDLLTHANGDSVLEIGYTKTAFRPETGYYAVIGAKRGTLVDELYVDRDGHLISATSGRPLEEYPYIVLAIEATSERENWFEIPDVAQAYAALRASVKTGVIDQVVESMAVFKRITLTSPDLLFRDAELLIRKVQSEIDSVTSNTGLRGRGATRGASAMRDLAAVALYG